MQEELEQIFLADQQKQKDLEQLRQTSDAELREAREQADRITNQLQPRLQELEQQLQTSDAELRDAREEAELTLLQLHQVQEELEHYFLLSRGQDVLLNQYGEQQLRVQQLLGRLITGAEAPAVALRH